MKHIEFAWIEQVLSFDFPEEVDAYLKELDNKGIQVFSDQAGKVEVADP